MLSLQGNRDLPCLQRNRKAGLAEGEAVYFLLPARKRKMRKLSRVGDPGPGRPSHCASTGGKPIAMKSGAEPLNSTCREIRLQNVPSEPRRGGKRIAGGSRPRLGYCIYGAPAGAKGIGSRPSSVAHPGLCPAFRPNPGLAPGAIICSPLRGLTGGRANIATESG